MLSRVYRDLVGLVDVLGYSHPAPGMLRRRIIGMASTRSASTTSSRIMPTLDGWALRLSGGRSTLTSLAIGLPVLWLTTIGARTGQPRTTPLVGFPVERNLAVIGTSFGQKATPAWVHNLEADPTGVVSYRGVAVPVRARHAERAEETASWETATRVYRGYGEYADRASHRRIRVFVLEPEGD
jgi:deazaflavin-dependent oxidoreductase (nitroreductase family)